MHKLSGQFCTLHCSSFILKPNVYTQNNIPFVTVKCKEPPPPQPKTGNPSLT